MGVYETFDSVDLDGNGGRNDDDDVQVSFDIPANASSGDYRFDIVASYAGTLKYTFSEILTVEGGSVVASSSSSSASSSGSYAPIELNPSSSGLSLTPSSSVNPGSLALVGQNSISLDGNINLNALDLPVFDGNLNSPAKGVNGSSPLTGYLIVIAIIIFLIAAIVFSFVL